MSFEQYSIDDPYASFGGTEKYYCYNKKKWIETDRLDYAIKPSDIKHYVKKYGNYITEYCRNCCLSSSTTPLFPCGLRCYNLSESGYSSPNDYYSPNRNPYFDDDNWDQREHDRDEELRRQD